MARRKRSRRSRSTTPEETRVTTAPDETVEEAHARMAAEWSGPKISDEEIEAEVEREEQEATEEADALENQPDPREMTDEELREMPVVDLDEVPVEQADPGVAIRRPAEQDPLDWSLFEKGPLAAGVLILDALLTEARSSYIAQQIETLEGVLEEEFSWDDRAVLTSVASQLKNASGLPDIASAYRAMVQRRAEAA